MQSAFRVPGKEAALGVARSTGRINSMNELSPEWQLTALASKGELDNLEEIVDRQIGPHRKPPFCFPNIPADVFVEAAPDFPDIRDITQNVSIPSSLLKSS